MISIRLSSGLLLVFIGLISCKKFVTIDLPNSQLPDRTVFDDSAKSVAAVSGIYGSMYINKTINSGSGSVAHVTGLSADEFQDLSNYSENLQIVQNSIQPTNVSVTQIWNSFYGIIYQCNSVIEGVNSSKVLSSSLKNRLRGEVKFIRAFCLFNLTNLFGEIPIPVSTDYLVNKSLKRVKIIKVYEQIIEDLKAAQSDLDSAIGTTSDFKVFPSKWAASFLLSRVYLYLGKWQLSELEATKLISSSLVFQLNTLEDVFKVNSLESVWQLQSPFISGQNTWEGESFILPNTENLVLLSDELVSSFDEVDLRLSKWVGEIEINSQQSFFPYKYKVQDGGTGTHPITENSTIFRLGELYLIRAECRIYQDNITSAVEDIDKIRIRAGLPAIANIFPNIERDDLVLEVEKQRKLELFSEWGHRWFDLKRWDLAEPRLLPLKGSNWQATDVLYPIPQTDIDKNLNLTQNDGYN